MENQETEKEQITTEDTDDGDKPEATGLIERAYQENQRMESNLKHREELLTREEELHAKKLLSGTADAGELPPAKVEDTPQEYSAKVMRGEANPLE